MVVRSNLFLGIDRGIFFFKKPSLVTTQSATVRCKHAYKGANTHEVDTFTGQKGNRYLADAPWWRFLEHARAPSMCRGLFFPVSGQHARMPSHMPRIGFLGVLGMTI